LPDLIYREAVGSNILGWHIRMTIEYLLAEKFALPYVKQGIGGKRRK
jgi:hypothetical protein